MTDTEKAITEKIWLELVLQQKWDLLNLLSDVERGHVHQLRVKRQLVDSSILHNTIIEWMTRKGVMILVD